MKILIGTITMIAVTQSAHRNPHVSKCAANLTAACRDGLLASTTMFIALLAMTGCTSPIVQKTLPEQKTVTLGAAVQITGSNANTGRYYRDGYQLAVDQINQKGGVLIGGEKYRLALKILDNQSDVNLGVRQYEQLITIDKVDFLLGPFSSNDVLADSAVAEKYLIPMVQGGGASSEIFQRGYHYIFGTLPPGGNYYKTTIEMLGKLNPKPQTVALIGADDSGNIAIATGTRDLLEKAGLTLVTGRQFRFSEKNTDFSALLTLVKSLQPDVILWAGHESEAINFIRQMKSLDVNPRLLYAFTVGVPTADFRNVLGSIANYAYGMTAWLPSLDVDPTAPDATELIQRDKWFGFAGDFARIYRERYGYQPDYHAASAAADVETFVNAFEKAGTLDPEKVRNAIANSDFQCLYGHIHFDENGQIDLPQTVVQVQGDKVAPIFAEHAFLNKPIYPIPPWSKRP